MEREPQELRGWRLTPGRLIDLVVQLHRDEAAELQTLRRRDRQIGRRLGIETLDPAALREDAPRAGLVNRWLSEVDRPVHRGAEAMATLGLAAVVIGALLGYVAAAGVFWYDGSTPVNVVNVLAVFVALQAVTLVLLGVAATASGGGSPRSMNAGYLRGVLALSPGRWVLAAARLLPRETRDALEEVVGRTGSHQRVFSRVQKWQVLAWSQSMALAFNLAAAAGAMQFIVFSDLSFGWSTTLQVDASAMHAVTTALSLPWAAVWADAVPSPALVDMTQTYRAVSFESKADPRVAAGWWRFLAASMVFYGVLPRVATLLWTRWQLRKAVTRAVSLTPGVDRLLDRLTATLVETRATRPETSGEAQTDGALAVESVFDYSDSPGCVIAWAGASADAEALRAGGDRTLEDDAAAIAAAAQGRGRVRFCVKAWEPPVLEMLDFLKDLRAGLGEGRPVEVRLVGDGDRSVWKKKLASLGDPWLRLAADGSATGGATSRDTFGGGGGDHE